MKEWMERNRDHIIPWLAVLIIVSIIACAGLLVPNVMQYTSGPAPESAQTELANVELAVAAFMAAPDVPIRDLVADARISSAVLCNPYADAFVKTLAADPEFGNYSLTQDVNILISVDTTYSGTPIQSLTDFTSDEEFKHWYCVGPERRVVGFLSIEPYSNIRMIP